MSTRTKTRAIDPTTFAKVPEHSIELEKAVLGCIILQGEVYDPVSQIVTDSDFYLSTHAEMFRAMQELSAINRRIELVSLFERLRRNGHISENGIDGRITLVDLTQLTDKVTSWVNVEDHARAIKAMSQKRQIAMIAGRFYGMAFDPTQDAGEILNAMQAELNEVAVSNQLSEIKPFSKIVKETIAGMKEAAAIGKEMLGSATGFRRLDQITLGFSAPDFIILSAGPGEGKSTAALQMAKYMGLNGEPVAFFSLEMKDRQLMWKVFSSEIEADIRAIRLGALSQDQWNNLMSRTSMLEKGEIFICDKGGITIMDLISTIRMLVKKYKIKGVFIDYLQLITTYGINRKFGTREEEVNYISKRLKAACLDMDIWICALSQMNRMEKGSKRLYKKSDLRESGSLEQDADGILFIYRPAYHEVESMHVNGQQMNFEEEDVLYLIDKWRLGATGKIQGKFRGRFNRFEEVDTYSNWKPLAAGYDKPLVEIDPELPF